MALTMLPPPPPTTEEDMKTPLQGELKEPPPGYRWVKCPSCEELHLRPGTMRTEPLPNYGRTDIPGRSTIPSESARRPPRSKPL